MAETDPIPSATTPMPGRGRIVRQTLIGLGAVALVLGGAAAALQTPAGRGVVKRAVEDAVPGLSLGALGPGLPLRLVATDVAYADVGGAVATVGRIDVAWSPLDLLGGTLHVDHVEIDRPILVRLPDSPGDDDGDDASGGGLLPPVAVRIDRVRVDGARIEDAVAGETIDLRLRSDLTAGTGGDVALTFLAERTGDAPATLAGAIAVDLTTETLRVDVTAEEPAGGAVSALLGLEGRPAGRLAVAGEGPLADWRGTASGGFGEDLSADLDLRLAYGAWIKAQATGTVIADALVPADLLPLARGPLTVTADVAMPADGPAIDANLTLSGTVLAMAARFTSPDPERSLTAEVEAQVLDPAALATLIPDFAAEDLVISARIDGAAETAPLTLRAEATHLTVSDIRAGRPVFGLTATPATSWSETDTGGGVRVAGSLTTGGLSGTPVEPARSLVAKPFTAEIATEAALADTLLSLSRLTLTLPWATLAGDAVVDTETGGLSGAARVTAPSLAAFRGVTGLDWDGTVSASAAFDVDDTIRLKNARAIVGSVKTGDAALDALLARGIEGRTDVSVSQDGLVAVSNATLVAGGATAGGTVTVGNAISGTISVRIDDLAPVSDLAGTALSGAAAMNATLAGPVDDPAAAVALEAWNIGVDGTDVPRLSLRGDAKALATGPSGRVSVDVQGPSGPAALKARYAMPGYARLALSGLSLETVGLTAAGDVSVDLETALAQGRLDLSASDLAPAGELIGLALAGAVEGRVELVVAGGSQSARARLAARDLAAEGIRVARADLDADVALAGSRPTVTATLDLRDAAAPGVAVSTAALRAAGPPDAVAVTLDVEGRTLRPFTVSVAGEVRHRAGRTEATLSKLDADLDGIPARLRKPARIVTGADGHATDLAMALGDGALTLEAAVADATLDATLDVTALPLALAGLAVSEPAFAGSVDVKADLDLSPGADSATATLSARGFSVSQAGGRTMPPVDVAARVVLVPGEARIEATVRGPVDTPAKAELVLPVARAAGGMVPLPVETGPLAGAIHWSGDLSEIEPLIPVAGHRIAGAATVDFDLGGTLADPAVDGRATVTGGQYEHLLYGTQLTDIAAAVTGSTGGRLGLEMTAADGAMGSLKVSGTVDLNEAGGPAADVTASLAGFRAVRRDEADAAVSGDVSVSVAGPRGSVIGALVLDPVEVRLLDTLPATVSTLDVVEETAAGTPETDAGAGDAVVLDLDVTVAIPRRAFVRGRGIDSEWQGEIKIAGTSEKPVVDGTVRAVRGQASLFGKVFKITSGSVTLDGAEDPDPILAVAATTRANALDITLNVSGRASAPVLGFSSNPPLPQDEVLAQLLFGKRAGELGPAEALALADAVRTLQSGDGGMIDRIRSATGLDVLRASGGEDGPSVTAGKYVADGVFVGVNQGAEANSSSATVEVELTDSISVESTTGANADTSLGVNWKVDY